MANYYAKAIDILAEDGDFRRLVVEIAKRHPKAVVEAYRVIARAGYSDSSWEGQVIPLLEQGKKLDAIKLCRNLTNGTLKTAKELVEALMEELK